MLLWSDFGKMRSLQVQKQVFVSQQQLLSLSAKFVELAVNSKEINFLEQSCRTKHPSFWKSYMISRSSRKQQPCDQCPSSVEQLHNILPGTHTHYVMRHITQITHKSGVKFEQCKTCKSAKMNPTCNQANYTDRYMYWLKQQFGLPLGPSEA